VAESEGSPAITHLKLEVRDGSLLASFELAGGLDSETKARLASGLETSFDFRVELLRRRRFWPDARLTQHRVVTSAKFDSLSRRYSLLLKVDGEVERSSTTDRLDEMETWLTHVHGISMGSTETLLPPEDFMVRVKADFPPRFVLLFIPWNRDTSWARADLPTQPVTEHDTHRP